MNDHKYQEIVKIVDEIKLNGDQDTDAYATAIVEAVSKPEPLNPYTGEPETYVQLVINEDDYKGEANEDFCDEVLVSFGREVNNTASHWLGYEGYRLVRGDRFVFDPDETRTGF